MLKTLKDYIKFLFEQKDFVSANDTLKNRMFVSPVGAIKIFEAKCIESQTPTLDIYYYFINDNTSSCYKCSEWISNISEHVVEEQYLQDWIEVENVKWYELQDIVNDINNEKVRLSNKIYEYNHE